MKLHQDRDAFRVLINHIHDKTGYRTDVLEKDYYVVLFLEELAAMQREGLPAYFKGGTALYKALKTTNRFSEDIDLSVDTRGCTNSQNKKRLNDATKRYTALPRDASAGKTNQSEVLAIYTYTPITAYDVNDTLQRFERVQIEATSFTISEPVTALTVTPILYDLASDEQKAILELQYDVKPFDVLTITMERIFVDKLFAAEAYVRRSADAHRAFDAAKHMYDLAVMSLQPQILVLLNDEVQMARLLAIRMQEELERLDGVAGVLPKDFTFFTDVRQNEQVRSAYETMQRQYVLRNEDRIAYETAVEALSVIYQKLLQNNAWLNCKVPE